MPVLLPVRLGCMGCAAPYETIGPLPSGPGLPYVVEAGYADGAYGVRDSGPFISRESRFRLDRSIMAQANIARERAARGAPTATPTVVGDGLDDAATNVLLPEGAVLLVLPAGAVGVDELDGDVVEAEADWVVLARKAFPKMAAPLSRLNGDWLFGHMILVPFPTGWLQQ